MKWLTNHNDTVEVYASDLDCLREGCVVQHREFRYRVVAANGEIVESGEGYIRKADAVTAAVRHHPRVEVES